MQEMKETSTTTPEVSEEVKETGEVRTETKRGRKPGRKPGAKPGPKPGAKKGPAEIRMVMQYQNNDTEIAMIEEKVKAQFVAEGHRAGAIKKLDIYIKPEENAAYYVINEKFSGRVDLF